jgi:hypothetical protein
VDHLYVGADDDSPVFSIVQGDLHIPALSLAELAELAGTSGAGGELLGAAADADAAEAVVGQDAVPAEDYPIGAVPFWSELHAYSQFGHDDERFAGLARGGL